MITVPVPVLGWDVGGANTKVARVDGRCATPAIIERPFALWRDRQRLPSVLVQLADRIGRADVMAVTMTAELADCFATKREGVAFVVDAFETAFPGTALWIYGVDGRFRSATEARERPYDVAAANWMATAVVVARSNTDALLIDVGSTTADIIPIIDGRVGVAGWTDSARLRSGELVYTGCLRTPVCAIVQWLPFESARCRVAAEHFAIAADAHCWLGQIAPDDYTCDTPDGRGRTRSESGARLARMVCADADALGEEAITEIAAAVARAQTRQIGHAIRQVLRRLDGARPAIALLAGSGAFLGKAAAEANGLTARHLAEELGAEAARAAPAAAVAWLISELMDVDTP